MKNKTKLNLTGIIAVITITTMILLGYSTIKNENKIKATNPLPKASWDNKVGGNAQEELKKTITLTDGSLLSVGNTNNKTPNGDLTNTGKGEKDALIVKYDANGNKIWDKIFGGTKQEEYKDIITTNDGGYIAIGYTASPTGGDITDTNKGGELDALVVKYDASGNKVWDKLIGGNGTDKFESIIKIGSGAEEKYIIAGSSTTSNNGNITDTSNGGTEGLIIKIDGSGNILWNYLLGGNGEEELAKILKISDTEYLVGGYTTSSGSGDVSDTGKGLTDGLVAKITDSSGAITVNWNKIYGGSGKDGIRDLVIGGDGSIIAIGKTTSPVSGNLSQGTAGFSDGLLLKLDGSGNKTADKVYGGLGTDSFNSLMLETDGGVLVAGTTDKGENTGTGIEIGPKGIGGNDILLVKFDSSLNTAYEVVTGGKGEDNVESILALSNGDHLLTGNTTSGASGDFLDGNNGGTDGLLYRMTKGEVKITFEEMGGSTVADIVMAPGKVPVKPKDPIKLQWMFKGWYTNSSCTVPFNWNNALNSSITLYAKWEKSLAYSTHIANVGWISYVTDGSFSGTAGSGNQIEAVKIKTTGIPGLGIEYSAAVAYDGWQGFVADDAVAGTTGQSKRLEAIKIRLTGAEAVNYDVYYKLYTPIVDPYWLNWAKNGEIAGTTGYSARTETLLIYLVPKGQGAPAGESSAMPFRIR